MNKTTKRRMQMMLFILSCCLLSSCRNNKLYVQEASSLIYYIDKEATKLVSEGYEPKGTTTEEQVAEYVQLLEKMPESEQYERAKPETVLIKEFIIGKNGQVTLYFDSSYNEVIGTREVLMRAAIVKTLCQAEGIDSIEFYINGQPLMTTAGKPIGLMSEKNFIDNTGSQKNSYQYVYSTLYFANETGDALVESNLKIPYDGTMSTEQVVISQLISGPIEEGMKQTISENTKLLKISTKSGICSIDFNEAFLEAQTGISEQVAIYSVVNSLVELPHIYWVQFTINGEVKKQFQEKVDLSVLFERNLELLEGEN